MLAKVADVVRPEAVSFSPDAVVRCGRLAAGSSISDLLDKGADIATASKMAGPANVQTTARYDGRPEEAEQKAAKDLHIPCIRRK